MTSDPTMLKVKKDKKNKKEKSKDVEKPSKVESIPKETKDKKKKKNKRKAEEEIKEVAVQVEQKSEKSKKPKNEDSLATVQPATSQGAGSADKNDLSYIEHMEVKNLSTADVQAFREKNAITYTGDREYKPILKFHQAGFTEKINEFCKSFTSPTPIQSSCWPIILSGRDVVGIAQTGSGKTLAFTLPAFMHLQRIGKTKSKTPVVLVLAPTRELAVQSFEVCEKVGKLFGCKSACIYGGVAKYSQKEELNAGVQIVVATPGRLIDLMEEGAVDLSQVSYLVLDEADRMLDFGFEPAIRNILSQIAAKRQTIMLSATWPETIRKLASEFLSNPVKVTIGSDDLAVSHNVTQIVEVLDDNFAKEKRLIDILAKYHKSRDNRVLVFALYKKEAVRIENNLRYKGYTVRAIHGDLSQAQRTEALAKFKDGSCPLLVATDVAARGLDIPKVEYVINYTFPLTIDDYVHRIGRTGRAGNKGISHTFFTFQDKTHSGELINVLKSANQEVPESLMKFGTTVKKKEHKAYGAFFKDIDTSVKPTKIVFDD
ncbi:RNA-dependent ATPase [Entomophthora muscae]|uniref:RNA-dependent ATPase n=1 Tax=Entomophthora muscae TaxID=34485 RepID=A0ACC2S6Y9_9FUNG|nr:RNA-dependent ATPase [Entomophthora muscae]